MKKKVYACALFFALVWGLYGRKRVFARDVAKMRTTPGGRFRGSGTTGEYRPFGPVKARPRMEEEMHLGSGYSPGYPGGFGLEETGEFATWGHTPTEGVDY